MHLSDRGNVLAKRKTFWAWYRDPCYSKFFNTMVSPGKAITAGRKKGVEIRLKGHAGTKQECAPAPPKIEIEDGLLNSNRPEDVRLKDRPR